MREDAPPVPGEEAGDAEPVERDLSPEVAAIFVANHRDFLAFLERRVGSRALAEDLLQEAFVRGMRSISSDREESIIAWFYRTLRNAVIDHHRRRSTATRALDAFAAEIAGSDQPDAEMQGAVCQCVRRLAGTLKPEYATALQRIEIDGLAVKDYAAEQGITPGNAAVRIFRARKALRNQLARSCGTCAEHGCLDCSCSQTQDGCGPHEPHTH